MFCPYCRNENNPVNAKFCTKCGGSLSNIGGSAPEKPKPTAPSILINDKWSNALFEKGEMNAIGKFFTKAPGVGIALEVIKKLTGGLWVGGTTYLYTDALVFKPNFMNNMLHAGDVSWRIPLDEILDVTLKSGFGTDIITIDTSEGKFKFRCYGAKNFAVQIDQQRQLFK